MGSSLRKYEYYKEPEGKDVLGKVIGLAKPAMMLSMIISVSDFVYNERKWNIQNCLNRSAYWTFPIMSMAFAFSSVSYISASIRGKDDMVNGSIGAIAAVGTMHNFFKSRNTALVAIPIFVIAHAVVKTSADYQLPERISYGTKEIPFIRGYQDQFDFDFSYVKDIRPWKQ